MKAYTYLNNEGQPILSPFGETLREERCRHKLTQQALAEAAEVSQPCISRSEKGENIMTPEDLEKVAGVIGARKKLRQARAQAIAARRRARELGKDSSAVKAQNGHARKRNRGLRVESFEDKSKSHKQEELDLLADAIEDFELHGGMTTTYCLDSSGNMIPVETHYVPGKLTDASPARTDRKLAG